MGGVGREKVVRGVSFMDFDEDEEEEEEGGGGGHGVGESEPVLCVCFERREGQEGQRWREVYVCVRESW